jgi:hypothetical protein
MIAMRIRTSATCAAAVALVAVAAAACGGGGGEGSPGTGPAGGAGATGTIATSLPQGGEAVVLDPRDFSTTIDNPYWPMRPGTRWVYVETSPEGPPQRVTVTVTDRTRRIANGVRARVVRDVATEAGVPVEITDDWYAQDREGNVWYLGESVRNYEDGVLADRDGSFEAGRDGAQAGVVMPAHPVPGLGYRQEYLRGEAEDRATVVTVGEERVEVPVGYFATDVLMTRDLAPTEPRVQELKFYAPGVGPLLALHTDEPGERAALVAFTPGRRPGPDVGG